MRFTETELKPLIDAVKKDLSAGSIRNTIAKLYGKLASKYLIKDLSDARMKVISDAAFYLKFEDRLEENEAYKYLIRTLERATNLAELEAEKDVLPPPAKRRNIGEYIKTKADFDWKRRQGIYPPGIEKPQSYWQRLLEESVDDEIAPSYSRGV